MSVPIIIKLVLSFLLCSACTCKWTKTRSATSVSTRTLPYSLTSWFRLTSKFLKSENPWRTLLSTKEILTKLCWTWQINSRQTTTAGLTWPTSSSNSSKTTTMRSCKIMSAVLSAVLRMRCFQRTCPGVATNLNCTSLLPNLKETWAFHWLRIWTKSSWNLSSKTHLNKSSTSLKLYRRLIKPIRVRTMCPSQGPSPHTVKQTWMKQQTS